MDTLLAELTAIAGPEHVLTDPDLVAGYTTDWTRRFSGAARGVVRPADVAEVAAVLIACARHRAPVVPQGGNTGLVGGGVPRSDGAVVLSARRLRRLATVGGTIATNAGGIQTIRYGPTRAQLLGLEAVLAGGSVISRLGGIEADNTGYDLTQLLAGSEGTLGVITAARLRLWPAEPPTLTVLAGVPGIEAAAALQAEIRSLLPGVRAAEYFEAPGLALVRAHTGLPAPLGREHPGYLLVDAAASEDEAERIVVLAPLQDAAVAMDAPARARLWAYRERHTESIGAAGIPHKLDVALPLARLAAFRAELDEVIAKADARAIVFGHIGAGNLHVNVLGPAPDDDSVDDAVLRLAAEHGGTISAEHGIGRAKAAVLYLSRSPAEIGAMRAVKSAFDPAGLLNPGVLFVS